MGAMGSIKQNESPEGGACQDEWGARVPAGRERREGGREGGGWEVSQDKTCRDRTVRGDNDFHEPPNMQLENAFLTFFKNLSYDITTDLKIEMKNAYNFII